MKQKISIWILIVFCFAEIRPLWPFVDYYMNYEYISEVLCINKEKPITICNGKCYLNKQLKKAQETDTPDKKIPKVELEKIPMIFYENKFSTKKSGIISTDKQFTSYEFSIKEVFISPPTPPPKS